MMINILTDCHSWLCIYQLFYVSKPLSDVLAPDLHFRLTLFT
jgi:hypothetical protein